MSVESCFSAVNSLIQSFVRDNSVSDELCSQNLAVRRISEKFEEPQRDTAHLRREDAWVRWLKDDEMLSSQEEILGPHWAKARLFVHKVLSNYRIGPLVFTNGSSFEPLGPYTSLACKLTTIWTITHDCFDMFARYSYVHHALKFSVKKRFISYCMIRGWDTRKINRKLWRHYRSSNDTAFQIFKFKLHCIVTYVYGNRWSTVPKNNLKDRSICLEPLCNMLVQRAVGLGIRRCLKDNLGIDLDFLADVHRSRISDDKIATIDLSDCSDTISLRLIHYLLPRKVLSQVLASRSDMTFGPDGHFHVVRKVSSMGNGFTFDLMTLVLTALTRSFDATSTVFGDDIICRLSDAAAVVDNLKIAGFRVNLKKTNIGTGYRESCGAHYIDGEGYVTAFDIRWVHTFNDLIAVLNKVAILSYIYAGPFETLRSRIWSCVPPILLGATTTRLVVDTGRPPSYELGEYVRYGPQLFVSPPRNTLRSLRRICRNLCKPGRLSVALGCQVRQMPAYRSLRARDWDVFFQTLHSSRVLRRVSSEVYKSTLVARVDEEQIGFVNALLP